MKIKSLLIGSAAALVAAPAFAADVIIAEPEPVEYVEVCDVAGAGYFYIPGSRTCLQIGGLVRHELRFAERSAVVTAANGNQVVVTDFQDGWDSLVRAEITARTYTETELGALTSYIRFRANDQNADPFAITGNIQTGQLNVQGANLNGSTFVNDATIGLGGLLMGMSDTLYDGGIAGEFDSLGGDRVHFIRYTADLGAFSASLSAELERSNISQRDFVPNVVGQLSGDLGAFSVDLWAAYDDGDDQFAVSPAFLNAAGVLVTQRFDRDDEFSLKARVGADLGIFALQGAATYNSGVNYYDNDYEYSFAASASVGIGEKTTVTLGGQYFLNQLVGFDTLVPVVNAAGATTGFRFDNTNNLDGYRVGAVLDYNIVEGFDMKIAANYINSDRALTRVNAAGVASTVIEDDGFFSGFVRFDRSF